MRRRDFIAGLGVPEQPKGTRTNPSARSHPSPKDVGNRHRAGARLLIDATVHGVSGFAKPPSAASCGIAQPK
jgi:hypothetical protein